MEPQSSPPEAAGPDREPEFSNPMVRDGINTPDTRHVRSLFVNLAIIAGVVLALMFLFDLAANHLTPYIPFCWEKELFNPDGMTARLDEDGQARQRELVRLARRIAEAMALPDDMSITVHYSPNGMVNAFATLGGNVFMFQGLIDKLNSEDELAMVLAHEIAHVKHRDVVRGVVRGIGFTLLLAGLSESAGNMDTALSLAMAGYSRSQEEEADAEAVKALARLYGHAGGADSFFRTLAFGIQGKTENSIPLPPILSSHPDSRARLKHVAEIARANGFPATGELTPLPPAFASGGSAVTEEARGFAGEATE